MILYFWLEPDLVVLSRHPSVNRVIRSWQLADGMWAVEVTLEEAA